jgi:zinc and cadmium transporter
MRAELVVSLMPRVLALAVGALLGDAFLHLLPEVYKTEPPLQTGLLVMAGTLVFFVVEKWMGEHSDPNPAEGAISPLGPMSIIANSIHNFVDGMLIAGAFIAGRGPGIATFVAVALHEIPHEASNFAILLHAGYSRPKAVLVNFGVGVVAMLGAAVALLVGGSFREFPAYLLPFTAGCFVYLACSDLMPTLLRRGGIRGIWSHFALMVVGMGVMVALLGLEGRG